MTDPAVPSGLEALLAQATPGPWTRKSRVNIGTEPPNEWGHTNVAIPCDGGQTFDSFEANGRLIALAPDAVRLLIDMAAHLETTRNWVIANMGNPDDMDALLARFAALDQRAGTA